MFTDSMQGISTLSYGLFESIASIIKSNSFEQVSSDRVQFVSTEGDIYFPMSAKLKFRSGDSKEIPDFMLDGDSTPLETMSYSDFQESYLSHDITTIAFNKTVFLPTLLKRLAQDPKTYGVIVENGDYMVNPLHPAIAFSITSGLMALPESGNLHIFEWSDMANRKFSRLSTRKKKKEMDFYEAEFGKLFGAFQYLIKKPVTEKRTASVSDDELKRLVDSPLLEDINTRIDIRVDSNSDVGSKNIKSVIIPTQLAIGNMATPYYGFLHLTKPISSEICGYNFSPMMSGNVNQSTCEADTFADLSQRTGSGNVCAGSATANTPRGWTTMSKININSMFNDCIISQNGLMSFVKTSKKVSGAIWESIERDKLDIDKVEEDPEQRRTVVVEEE